MKDNLYSFKKFLYIACDIILILGIFFSCLIVVFSGYKIYSADLFYSNLIYYIFLFFSFIFIIFFLIVIKLSFIIKINTVLIILFTLIPIYSFEIYLEITQSNSYAAKKMGVQYDNRSNYEFFLDLKKDFDEKNTKVYPNFRSRDLFHEYYGTSNSKILPLGGLSNSITYFTNEAGFFPIIKTDNYGFANLNNKLYTNENLEILLIGDSFTEGYSVEQKNNYASLLNDKNYSTLSLGKSGSGSLIHLANLIEYGKYLKPEKVFWIHYDNDTEDLIKELNVNILKKYLDDTDFTQNLMQRQNEIDNRIIEFYKDSGLLKNSWIKKLFSKYNSQLKVIKLVNIRARLTLNQYFNEDRSSEKIVQKFDKFLKFKEIMIKSDNIVTNWKGKLYFVYLPSVYHVAKKKEFDEKKKLFNIINNLNIPIIDIEDLVFKNFDDPLALFPLRKPAHYNSFANTKIVNTLIDFIN